MLLRITHPAVTMDRYSSVLPPRLLNQLLELAPELKHLRFVHLNSTAVGGGVAEILQSLVPLMNSLGLETERVVINPPPQFFLVTKRIHNLLQGAEGTLSAEELEVYFEAIRQVADEILERSLEADVWFMHDPQLLPLSQLLPRRDGEGRFWVCHIDLTAPNQSVMDKLLPLTNYYDGLVFSLPNYVPTGLDASLPVNIVPPAIDPLTAKNSPMEPSAARRILTGMGIDTARPLVTQVSRFDMWKDPWGVVDAFRLARQSVPGLQLALLGLSQATDDPEALDVLNSVTEHAAQDPDIHLYFYPGDLTESIDTVVNAFQSGSQVIVQKSTREGFGLTVSEAMWKGAPVVGGKVGGIQVQINDGINGFLVNNREECAQRIVKLIQDPDLRGKMGAAAREKVRQEFLLPRLALDYLRAARQHARVASAPVENPRTFNGFHHLQVLPASD